MCLYDYMIARLVYRSEPGFFWKNIVCTYFWAIFVNYLFIFNPLS